MATCDECREITNELKRYFADAMSLLEQTNDDRLRVVDAMRSGEANAQVVEEFFAVAPRLRAGAYPAFVQAMRRKFMHERSAGHIIRWN